jgi:hypothetical protein
VLGSQPVCITLIDSSDGSRTVTPISSDWFYTADDLPTIFSNNACTKNAAGTECEVFECCIACTGSGDAEVCVFSGAVDTCYVVASCTSSSGEFMYPLTAPIT